MRTPRNSSIHPTCLPNANNYEGENPLLLYMDDETNLQELKDQVQAFCEARDWDQFHNPLQLAVGTSTEANELLDIFRFGQPDELEDILREKEEQVREELADTLYFILRFAQLHDIDLSEAFEKKMEKNQELYPEQDFTGSNLKKHEQ